MTFILLARDDEKGTDGKFVCLRPKPNEHGEKLLIGISFHQLAEYVTMGCLGLATVSALVLIWRHLHHYTRPKEQRQNIRIIIMPVYFCVVSLLSILFYEDSIYITPLLELVCPDEGARPEYFSQLENKDKKGNIITGGSGKWFNHIYFMVFQYPFTKTIATGVQIGTQAADIYCPNSLSPKYAHIWLMLVELLVIGGAIGGVFGFYGRLKPEFNPKYHPLGKLVCFKGIVILLFLQDIIFGFLNSKLFQPTATLTFDDLYFGMPLLLTAIEATIISFTFHWAFSPHIYHEDGFPERERLPIWHAALDAMNLSDIVKASIKAWALLFTSGSGALSFGSSKPRMPLKQRTLQLDDMGREPLTHQTYGHSYTNPHIDTRYQPPSYPPSSSLPNRRYSSSVPPAFQQVQVQAESVVGQAQCGYQSIGRQDPSPEPDQHYSVTPCDVV
ncbi:hypothetical protein LTR84_005844 [Exophiala bonariae]|uniref:Organic solute transporter Ostalpha-domain-containing protein n=1 Tax=Exophiala bonariae TaxID=1690606 RepID=A0AAV9N262_9EURO|nr:hypothetical protein LTR84_005844 [Exophiala bonariae]